MELLGSPDSSTMLLARDIIHPLTRRGPESGRPLAGFYLGAETYRPAMRPRKLDFSGESTVSRDAEATYYSDRFVPHTSMKSS